MAAASPVDCRAFELEKGMTSEPVQVVERHMTEPSWSASSYYCHLH